MNNEQITVSRDYIHQVDELLNLQQRYFAAAIKAKQTKLGIHYQESKDILRECKQLEEKVRIATAGILGNIHGKMTADQAISEMKKNLSGEGAARG